MSNPLNGTRPVFVKTVSVLTSVATMLSLSGAAYLAPLTAVAAVPSDYGLTEGNMISASGTNDPDVYIVNALGYKRLFLNPAIFNMYGHLTGGWALIKNVTPAARDAFPTSGLFRNCETNAQQVWAVEVTGEDTGVFHKIVMSGDQAVAEDANFFKKVFCINSNEQNWYAKSTVDYTALSQVPVYSRVPGATPTSTPSANLSAGLAIDNPAPGTLVATQALADLAHFAVGGSGLVTSVELKRLGVSGDATLSNVFLFVNGVRVSDAGNVSSGMITFNNASGFFSAPATLVVKSDILTGTAGQTVGVQLTGLNAQDFTVSGNLHSIATANLATAAFGAPTGSITDPQNDAVVWKSTVTVGVEDIYVKRLTIREIGSVDNSDVRNLRLFIGGVQVATDPDLDVNGYATFLLNYRVAQGSPEFKILADVVGGSTRTLSFSLRGAYDFEAMDEAYNVNIVPTGSFPLTVTASTITGGSVTAVKTTDSPSGDVVDAATNVALARFELKAFGEAVKIETLSVKASVSDSGIAGLTNGRLMINGVQYGNTTTLLSTASTSFTVNYTLAAGATAIVEVRADMIESGSGTDVTNGDIIEILLDNLVGNGSGVSSANLVAVPTSTLEANEVTVASATATLTKQLSYSDQVVTLPQSGYKIGSWTLIGSSAEAVNLNTLSFDINTTDSTTFDFADLSNMYVVYGSTTSSPKSTITAADNDYSISRTLAVNEVLAIDLYATLGSDVTVGDSFTADLSITGTGVSSGVTVANNNVYGQEIDTGAGSLTVARNTGVANSDQIVGDEQTVRAVGYQFTAVNESFKLSRLQLTLPDATGISEVRIMDGTTLVMTLPASATMTFNINSANQPTVLPSVVKELAVDLVLSTIASPSGGASGANHTVTLVTANSRKIASGGETALTGSNVVGKLLYAYKAIPTVSWVSLPSTALVNGTRTLAKFSVGAGGTGTIGWSKVILTYSATGGVAFTDTAFYDASNESTALTGTVASASGIVFTSADELSAGDYVVKATVYNATGDDAITVGFDHSALGFAAPVASASVAGAPTFVWTDRFSLPHTDLTPDWNNDYLVKNLPLNSWSQSD